MMELVDYERFSVPEREGGRLFFQRNSGLQNQAILYWQEGEEGEASDPAGPEHAQCGWYGGAAGDGGE